MLTESRKACLEWLLHEHASAVILFRMYHLMRAALIVGAVAGIGVITNIYRESIRAFRWTTLEASGIVTHTERVVPEPLAVAFTSAIIIAIAIWVIWIDHYFELHQRICERRCRDIEMAMLDRFGLVGQLSRAHHRGSNMFLLGRGLLLLLTIAWVVVFGGISISAIR